MALGCWSRDRSVEDDLGRPPPEVVQRAGVERMVAEVCLGKLVQFATAMGLALRTQQPVGTKADLARTLIEMGRVGRHRSGSSETI